MVTGDVVARLQRYVDGEASLGPTLFADSAAVAAERDRLPALTLTPAAVIRVLLDLQDGSITAAIAREWARFVSRGWIPAAGDAQVPAVDIQWEDDAIAEALARIGDLGDIIDGTIGPAETAELIAALNGVPGASFGHQPGLPDRRSSPGLG